MEKNKNEATKLAVEALTEYSKANIKRDPNNKLMNEVNQLVLPAILMAAQTGNRNFSKAVNQAILKSKPGARAFALVTAMALMRHMSSPTDSEKED